MAFLLQKAVGNQRIWLMKIVDHKEAQNRLNDPLWGLNNLYWIIDKARNKSLFNLNWAQKKLYPDMWYCNVILKRACLVFPHLFAFFFLIDASVATNMQELLLIPEKMLR